MVNHHIKTCFTRFFLKYTGGALLVLLIIIYIGAFVLNNDENGSRDFMSKGEATEHDRNSNINTRASISSASYREDHMYKQLSNLEYDNPILIELIRSKFIDPPSLHWYNLNHPNKLDYSSGQTPFIDNRLNFMTNGFFVECGALDGEQGSTTLFLEKTRNWTGLLIEADPENYQKLKLKNRKAFISNACLSPSTAPAKMTFNKAVNRGRVVHDKDSETWIKSQHLKDHRIIQSCFPLYSFMLALNRTVIDFFTLDVEGDELNVLKTIPFNKITIRMITVEYVHVPGQSKVIRKFMESKGYETLLTLQSGNGGMLDIIFKLNQIHQIPV